MSGELSLAALLEEFDIFDKAHADRMEEFTRYAREVCPVPHTSARTGAYLVTRYDDVRQVLEDHRTYSSAGDANIVGTGGLVSPPIDADPPLHHDFRRLLNPFFHPRRLAEFEQRVQQIARDTMAPWLATGRCDLVEDYAGPFVTDVLASVVFEEKDEDVFRQAGAYMSRIAVGDAAAFGPLFELLTGFVAGRAGDGSDIVSALNTGTVQGRPLSDAERIGAVLILFAGGLDTTKVAISNIIAELAKNPELEQVLRTPGWDRHVLDEFLRYDSPISALGRVAVRDAELGGRQIRAGDRLDVHYASANRDAAVFESPDELDFGRVRNPHVAFGLGVHRCIGMHLARMQIRISIEEFLRVATRIRLTAGTTLSRRPGVARIFEELPIEFDLRVEQPNDVR